MNISGPVGGVVCSYKNRNLILLSDQHDSTEGACGLHCRNICEGKISGYEDCYTLSYYIHSLLIEGVDLYLESSFVTRDNGVSPIMFENPDNIDILLREFHNCFLRDKRLNNYLERSWCHYCDIRDVFDGEYTNNGTRDMKGANPFSGSYLVRYLEDNGDVSNVENLISFILKNAKNYFNYFCFGDEYPVPPFRSPVVDEFLRRSNRRLESTYNNKKMHRVQKQLEKLDVEDRNKIVMWAMNIFSDELSVSIEIYNRWKVTRERMGPVACLVALSSVLMDIYTISRIIYHNNCRDVVVYAGLAHINNYTSFFSQNGGVIEKKIKSLEGLSRCVSL